MSHTSSQRKPRVERHRIDPTALFSMFGNKRRQHAISYLAQTQGDTHLGDLAEYIAIREEDLTEERHQRISTELHHVHLPAMRAAGVVEYDDRTELVTLRIPSALVVPYLDLAGYPSAP